MFSSPPHPYDRAGQAAWTRALARDLFPIAPTPFHWTLLRQPLQTAMHRAWTDLGVTLPGLNFWDRGADGHIYLNADLVRQANRPLYGAAWLVTPPDPTAAGLFARLQAQGIIRRTEAQMAHVVAEAAALQARLADWLAWIGGLHWTQADLLQVMEELEPHALAALRLHFIARAGLAAGQARVADLLRAAWPDCPTAVLLGLYAGVPDLPSVEAACALAGLRAAADPQAAQQAFLACHGHRGLAEASPHALRWREQPDRLRALAALPAARDVAQARRAYHAAVETVQRRLGSRWRQLEPALDRARALCRAVDLTWDAFVRVMAAAQAWLSAVAVEARTAGLIADVADAAYLEIEELKQVATGEWHRGRSDAVAAAVARRRAEWAISPPESPAPPQSASPGQASGPLFRLTPAADLARGAGVILLTEVAEPGQAVLWLAAAGLLDAAGDPWSPGMIVARSLAVPAISGVPDAIWGAVGQIVTMNAEVGCIEQLQQVA